MLLLRMPFILDIDFCSAPCQILSIIFSHVGLFMTFILFLVTGPVDILLTFPLVPYP